MIRTAGGAAASFRRARRQRRTRRRNAFRLCLARDLREGGLAARDEGSGDGWSVEKLREIGVRVAFLADAARFSGSSSKPATLAQRHSRGSVRSHYFLRFAIRTIQARNATDAALTRALRDKSEHILMRGGATRPRAAQRLPKAGGASDHRS